MTGLLIVRAGPATTLQDGGRRAARFGVPRSGPMDRVSLHHAAWLAGHEPSWGREPAGVEVGPGGCTLRADGDGLDLAIVGAGAEAHIDGVVHRAPCVVHVPSDGELTVTGNALWSYVVPAAEVAVEPVLGSVAHHPRSGLGLALAAGTSVPLRSVRSIATGAYAPVVLPTGALRILAAPQTNEFTQDALACLVREAFMTTTVFDRMGHRLQGPPLEALTHDIVSDGVVAGTLQVPGDGQVFVLTADHQSSGGYPKVAVLDAVSLARFVRLTPGTEVRFRWSDVAAARADLRAALAAIERSVRGPATPAASVLTAANLIGGVTDGG